MHQSMELDQTPSGDTVTAGGENNATDTQPKAYVRVLTQDEIEQTDFPIYEGIIIHICGMCM